MVLRDVFMIHLFHVLMVRITEAMELRESLEGFRWLDARHRILSWSSSIDINAARYPWNDLFMPSGWM